MRQVVEGSIRAGEKVTRTAERLLDADLPSVEVPRHVSELAEAAKFRRGPGDVNLFDDAVRKWRSTVSRLGQGAAREPGEFTIRSATQQLVRDLERAKPEQVDRIVDRWILERARYQARVVARQESVEAFREVTLRSFAEQAWVKGVRWTLSPAHPRPDICDMHASVDRYGLGPGGYPVDAVPDRHVSCLCSLVPISDRHHFARARAERTGDEPPPEEWKSGKRETAEDWLRRQDKATRTAVAGPTRARLVEGGRNVYEPGSATFKPVHKLLGKPKPTIARGPRVDATRLVIKDRANQVRPFPDLRK